LKTNDNNEIFLFDNQRVDQGACEFMKYLINFIFYRFGLEVKQKNLSFEILIEIFLRFVTQQQ
jgi:hypothetical protein